MISNPVEDSWIYLTNSYYNLAVTRLERTRTLVPLTNPNAPLTLKEACEECPFLFGSFYDLI